jgi:hypothetical protein
MNSIFSVLLFLIAKEKWHGLLNSKVSHNLSKKYSHILIWLILQASFYDKSNTLYHKDHIKEYSHNHNHDQSIHVLDMKTDEFHVWYNKHVITLGTHEEWIADPSMNTQSAQVHSAVFTYNLHNAPTNFKSSTGYL